MPHQDLPTDLARLVWTLHRTLLQATRTPVGEHVRPPAQVELLQLVTDRPGVSVREAAGMLRMQPNNVSTLVTQLVKDGLLERSPHPDDRRQAQLRPTPRMLAEGREVNAGIYRNVEAALSTLSPGAVERIAAALPDLRDLAEAAHQAP
ncbi:MarR family winged helix-turn-helix transcriptional regulator [Streptomyces sp. NPDC057307]|uniref:MarR family winged helix-turn-helix transcriptional regulator n=1 Tax=Streptomyces sp. NPDC057307 TaxID=3346096 RepID=UPI0036443706